MQEKTAEQYQSEINRLQRVIGKLASSKGDDAIFIAELKSIVEERDYEIEQLKSENASLKQAITASVKDGETNEATINQ
ncbi:hypothetical protein ACFSY7_15130 [Kurthia populi]|uniref:Uncharacterized protein n=1 Tax=Kurthia populi TaxID=1562132 RepID=A0ABW5Y4B7_9BACL